MKNIPYDLSSFKVLIRKVFPPKKSVFTVDTTGDGYTDSILIKFLNLIFPFVIPKEIKIGDTDLNNFDLSKIDLSEYAKIMLDDNLIEISTQNINLDDINELVKIFHSGESFGLNDILTGKLSGRTIAMGDKIDILIKLDNEKIAKLTKGMHFFKIESELISNLIIPFELNNKNMNIEFD